MTTEDLRAKLACVLAEVEGLSGNLMLHVHDPALLAAADEVAAPKLREHAGVLEVAHRGYSRRGAFDVILLYDRPATADDVLMFIDAQAQKGQ